MVVRAEWMAAAASASTAPLSARVAGAVRCEALTADRVAVRVDESVSGADVAALLSFLADRRESHSLQMAPRHRVHNAYAQVRSDFFIARLFALAVAHLCCVLWRWQWLVQSGAQAGPIGGRTVWAKGLRGKNQVCCFLRVFACLSLCRVPLTELSRCWQLVAVCDSGLDFDHWYAIRRYSVASIAHCFATYDHSCS